MKVLIKYNAQLDRGDNNGTTVLHFVCESYPNPTEAVVFLTKAGADCNSRDAKKRTPLMVLLQNTHITSTKVLVETMRVLFKFGALTKVADHQYQRTPLHYAIQHCKELAPVIELLLKKGADVNAVDSRKATPLH
ncbi:ankyrin repeat-containing domain protein, partial [Dissophora ornata]